MTERDSKARIVVGVDGSDQSKEALRWAARLAEALNAKIDAMIVWDVPDYTYNGWNYDAAGWHPEQAAADQLDNTLEEVFGKTRPAGLRQLTRRGNAAKELINAAADARMLVVGSRGHGGFAGLLLGSVSAHCAAHATCPVLVTHCHKTASTAAGR